MVLHVSTTHRATYHTRPFWTATYLVSRPDAAVGLMVLPGFLVGVFLGPTFALGQALVEPSHRALSAAVLLVLANLVGYGLGPLAVGVLSDALAPRVGADSLRYALAAASVFGAWSAVHYLVAGRALPAGRTARSLTGAS